MKSSTRFAIRSTAFIIRQMPIGTIRTTTSHKIPKMTENIPYPNLTPDSLRRPPIQAIIASGETNGELARTDLVSQDPYLLDLKLHDVAGR